MSIITNNKLKKFNHFILEGSSGSMFRNVSPNCFLSKIAKITYSYHKHIVISIFKMVAQCCRVSDKWEALVLAVTWRPRAGSRAARRGARRGRRGGSPARGRCAGLSGTAAGPRGIF